MKSDLFYTNKYRVVEEKIQNFLNAQSNFLSPHTSSSTRAVGDAIQTLLSENFVSFISDRVKEYSSTFARRAMADLAFSDKENFYYIVDVKTHRLDTHFNMPNLTSVERLARFYEDDKNYFIILTIAYNLVGASVKVEKVNFIPIEFLSWECLTIGALGWGQIQIANSNKIILAPQGRKKMDAKIVRHAVRILSHGNWKNQRKNRSL